MTMPTWIHLIPVSLLLVVAGACDDKNSGTSATAATSPGESSSTTDEGQSSEATTDDGFSTGGSGSPTTGEESAGSGGNPPEPDAEALGVCQDLCELMAKCGFAEDVAECAAECAAGVAEMSMCGAEYLAAFGCIAAEYECQDFLTEDLVSGPCSAEGAALGACTGMEPEPSSCQETGASSGSECSLVTECEDAPTMEFKCDAEVCVCLLDGQKLVECPSEGVCEQGDALYDKRASCCFDFE